MISSICKELYVSLCWNDLQATQNFKIAIPFNSVFFQFNFLACHFNNIWVSWYLSNKFERFWANRIVFPAFYWTPHQNVHIKKGCFTQSLPRRYFHRSLFRAAFRPIQKLGSVAVDPGKVGAHQTSDFGSWPTFWELNREPRTFKAGKPLNNSEFPHQKCGSWPIQVEFTGENWDLTLTIKDVGWTHWRFDLTKKRMILAIYIEIGH